MKPSTAALRARIADIDARITLLANQIAGLEAEKTRVKQDLYQVTYPVLSLPDDIIGEIFAHLVDTDAESPFPTPGSRIPRDLRDPRSPYYALTLAAVCARWRAISLSTSKLWRRIQVECRSSDAMKIRSEEPGPIRPIALLELWLSRSGIVPVDICIIARQGSSEELFHKALLAISPFAQRWHRVDLCVEGGPFELPYEFPTNLDELRYLSLQGSIQWTQSTTIVSPQVHALSIVHCPFPSGLFSGFNLTTLKILEIDWLFTSDILRFLERAPALQSLYIEVADPVNEPPEVAPAIPAIFPSLQTLVCKYDFSLNLMRFATFPGLRSLAIWDLDLTRPLVDCVRTFMTSSKCRITHLHLRNLGPQVSSGILISTLVLFSHVTHLIIEHKADPWPRGTLVGLASNAFNDEDFLPALECLALGGPSREATLEGLVDFVRFRAEKIREGYDITELREVFVQFATQLGVQGETAELAKLGVQLRVGELKKTGMLWSAAADG
uniref:F-box domain-containing protein n=1 Tax=Mycena chlorophos TaxID=658473 RepID=A0ABQ0M163_MYCCL|nr:predicted protein [Mycena chlorophos]